MDVVCLQETKIKEVSTGLIRSLGVGRFLDWAALRAEGASGGIVIFWDSRVLNLLAKEEGQFTLSCRFKFIVEDSTWVFTGVYGPTVYGAREFLWDELGAIKGLWNDPWCIGGDFNITRFPSERSREGRITGSMRRFSQVIDDLELRDFPVQGGRYTWKGGLNNCRMARLDRFLVSEDWDCLFGGTRQSILPRPTFDHFPILLEGGRVMPKRPSPFRFENMWIKEEGFKDLIKVWWQRLEFRGTSSYVLTEKMKAIKNLLKIWNKEVFGRVEENKKSALAIVADWDNLESERPLSSEELGTRMTAVEDFKKWSLMEETTWRQKSRELWLKEGDRNTGFFHRMTISHKKSSTIERIRIGGNWLEGDGEVRTGIVNAFQDLLSDPGFWRASPEGLDFSRIEASAASKLEEPFTENEIHAASLTLNGDKAPGPDGFTAAFWQLSWDFVKLDILDLFKDFHERGRFGKGLNSTFLVLIPKIRGAEDLKDFRPISLIGSIYKLIAKVLANRLKKVMNGLVNLAQNAFVEGRQILDASFIANDVIDSMQKRKERGILCKLDIEKAYDQINWKFILKVLKKMGFGDKWVSWIEWCISTATFSVLVNGSPTGFFGSSRGLRQGDPLSPYLFVLGMEALSVMIDKAAEGGFISGYMFKGRDNSVKQITHLLFADDTLVFCKDTEDQMTHLCWILAWFEALSGLKINLEKSSLLPVGRVEDVDGCALELGCKIGSLPTEYLGLPLGAKHKDTKVWDGVEERFRNRLALWKRQYISKGGRLTLIKSVLSNMPTYLLSLLRIPKKVKFRL